MSNLKFSLLFVTSVLVLIVDCRQTPYRYNFLGSLANSRRNLTIRNLTRNLTTTTTTTTLPSTTHRMTTTQKTTTTTMNSSISRLINNRPYNMYENLGYQFILPMLGNTKPKTTTVASTTKRTNSFNGLSQRLANRYCLNKEDCVLCAKDQGQTCCYKPGANRGPKIRGTCRCVRNQIELRRCE